MLIEVTEIYVDVEITETVKECGRVTVSVSFIKNYLLDKGIKFGIIKEGRSWLLSNQTRRSGTFIFEKIKEEKIEKTTKPKKPTKPRKPTRSRQTSKTKTARSLFKPSSSKED